MGNTKIPLPFKSKQKTLHRHRTTPLSTNLWRRNGYIKPIPINKKIKNNNQEKNEKPCATPQEKTNT